MKILRFIFLCSATLFILFGQAQNKATFDNFMYFGNDSIFSTKLAANTYRNPILAGFYPDPSICRKGDNFFLVNSSFSFYPGIPIFTSSNLIDWIQLGHVLNRPSQLNLDHLNIREGIYAPAITYNKENDIFYLICTSTYGIGNFLVITKDPAKGWSEPIILPDVKGIDPSLFIDDNGKAYILNNDAPAEKAEYEGHRAIWLRTLDLKTFATGKPAVILDGGADKTKKTIWIEGPHLYKRNGKYLLICAEGGTGTDHSEVALLSDSIDGPYVSSELNPVLTQRDLSKNRNNKVTCTGHADLIDDIDGKTYAVFLGCRPYDGNLFNTGRETFMLPVEWKGDIPVILEKGKPLPFNVQKNGGFSSITTGNFTWMDDFRNKKLDDKWLMIRTPRSNWYSLANGKLTIDATNTNIYEKLQPAFLGVRQQHADFRAEVNIDFQPTNNNELAGMVCFQNETYNIVFGKTIKDGIVTLIIDRSAGKTERLCSYPIPQKYRHRSIKLRIDGHGASYGFYASFDGKTWKPIMAKMDARNLSTDIAGGFTGTIIGLYASGSANKNH